MILKVLIEPFSCIVDVLLALFSLSLSKKFVRCQVDELAKLSKGPGVKLGAVRSEVQ